MTTALAPAPAKPDPAQLTAVAGQVKTLEARLTELTARHTMAAAELEAERASLGRAIAADNGPEVTDGTRARIRELTDDADGLARGVATVQQQLAGAKQEHTRLNKIDADRALAETTAAMGESKAAVDLAVRAFATGVLADVLAQYYAARGVASAAWGRAYEASGRTISPMMAPANDQFSGYPDLRDLVGELQKYAAGNTAGQGMARMGEAHREAIRFAHDRERQRIEAERGDEINNRGSVSAR